MPIVFVTDLAGGEVTLTVQQAAELVATLCELPDPMPRLRQDAHHGLGVGTSRSARMVARTAV